MCVLQYDPDLLNSFDSNPKRHLNYAARYSRSESLVDEEDAMLSYEALPWNSDLEGNDTLMLALFVVRYNAIPWQPGISLGFSLFDAKRCNLFFSLKLAGADCACRALYTDKCRMTLSSNSSLKHTTHEGGRA